MYHHVKKLMYTVDVGTPDPRFGNMLLEQFGGANGELAAAMQYSIQGMNCDDPGLKDLLMDIGTEELSHLEVIGALARLHLKPMKEAREAAEADPLVAIAGGGGVCLFNSMGNPWTADYLKITGELDVDLRSNIAAEARAKIVYERLINFCDDPGTKDALQFLMTREITHLKAFTLGLESLGKNYLDIGTIPPSEEVVNLYFNDSTGTGDEGETDTTGPWNEGEEWEIVQSPAFEDTSRQDEVKNLTGERKARSAKSLNGRSKKKSQYILSVLLTFVQLLNTSPFDKSVHVRGNARDGPNFATDVRRPFGEFRGWYSCPGQDPNQKEVRFDSEDPTGTGSNRNELNRTEKMRAIRLGDSN